MVVNFTANVYLPALYICGNVWNEKKEICMIVGHAFLSCDHWFLKHFLICSTNVLYKNFSVP